VLSEDLFRLVIEQLKDYGFRGNLTFNLYNEPLCDERLPRLVRLSRAALPGAFLYLNTKAALINNMYM